MGISVVIPTYNSATFLRETLGSVLAQTRLPEEIIVVDDASADGTPEIVRELAATIRVPLRLIELVRNSGGPATPMNVGIEAARGEYVALLDHDDLMLPEKVATQALVLDRHPAVELVLSDFAIVAAHGVRHRDERWPWIAGEGKGNDGAQTLFILDPFACQMDLMRGNRLGVTCTNYLFRKSLWSRLSGFRTDAGVATDFDFLLRATDKPVAWLSQALFWKRQHDANLWRGNSQGNLLVTTIRERWLQDTASTFEAERHKALRRECLGATVETALGLYLDGCLDEFDRLRQPLRTQIGVPLVTSLLEFDPCRRRHGRARLWADAVKIALGNGPLRPALTRAYQRRGWQRRHGGQFLRAASDFAHAILLRPGNLYLWRWLVGSLLRRPN